MKLDLFGKKAREAIQAPEPFYCCACGSTRSKWCRKCGTRHCSNTFGQCEFSTCQTCEFKQPTPTPPPATPPTTGPGEG
jgi:hypothetical protein